LKFVCIGESIGIISRRKPSVGWSRPGDNRAVGERVGRRDQSGHDQRVERCSGQTVDQALDTEPVEPILLALAGDIDLPPAAGKFGREAGGDGLYWGEEPPPIVRGATGVDGPTIRAPPTLHGNGVAAPVEVAEHETMSP